MTLRPTLADGLAVTRIGARPFAILKDIVDRVVTVDEASIALAILRLIELEKSVVEGAGATPLAAFLAGKLDGYGGKRVVLALCGGNIDLTMLDRVIEVGLVADPPARFTVSITDRPGGLAQLADVIASTGAGIKEIVHDRVRGAGPVGSARSVRGRDNWQDASRRSAPCAGRGRRQGHRLAAHCGTRSRTPTPVQYSIPSRLYTNPSNHTGPTSSERMSSRNAGLRPSK